MNKTQIILTTIERFNDTMFDFLNNNTENPDLVIDEWNDPKHQQSLKNKITVLVEKNKVNQIEKLLGKFVTDFLFDNTENAELVIDAWDKHIKSLTTIKITNYSEKSLVIRGPKEKMPIDQLKQLNARWNPHLHGGPGWIISKKKEEEIRNLFKDSKYESKEESSEEESEDESGDESDYEEKKIDYVSREHKIKEWTKNLSEDDKRGVRALILGCKMLSDTGFTSMSGKEYPKLMVYTDTNNLIMEISYESPDESGNKLSNMYKVVEELPNKISKELSFYYDDLKDYLIETFGTESIRIDHIYIVMKKDIYRLFYDQHLGILWDKTECFKCYKILKEFGIDCTYENCGSNAKKKLKQLYLKHHPDKGGDPNIFKKIQHCGDLVVINECLSDIRHRPSQLSVNKGLWSEINNTDVFGNINSERKTENKENLVKKISQDINRFCTLLRNNKVKDSKEAFEKLPVSVQRLFLHHCWTVLSNKNQYSEDSYKTSFLLFKLFRSKEWKEKSIYKRYLRLSSLESYYKKANDFFKKQGTEVKSGPKKSASKSSKRSTSKSSKRSASKSSKRSTSKSSKRLASKSSKKSVSKSSKKYDKEFQRFQEPKELDPLYLFYTSLYSQKINPPLAITWLTEHGVFDGSERKSLVKKYEKLKQAGKLIK